MVEVVNPELVEIAQDDVFGAVGDQVQPVFERLAVMLLQFLAAFLHFQQEPRPPEQVGELGALALVDAVFEGAAGLHDAGVAECLEKAVTEDLGLALLVALDVLADEGDELVDFGGWAIHGKLNPGAVRTFRC